MICVYFLILAKIFKVADVHLKVVEAEQGQGFVWSTFVGPAQIQVHLNLAWPVTVYSLL